MASKILIIYIPVIHKGYLDFLNDSRDKFAEIYLMENQLVKGLSDFEPAISAIETESAKELLEKSGFSNVFTLTKNNISNIKDRQIALVNDEVSRNLCQKYLKGNEIEWLSVFLRWDKKAILAERAPEGIDISEDSFDNDMIGEAKKEGDKSGDWWRQVGAVLVRDKKIILRGYNKGMPDDYTPYQVGAMRDFFKAGEKQDISPTIHGEQMIIAQAAKEGISLKGASIYLTHFPCPLCAKLIAFSGIKKLCFSGGNFTADSRQVLESAGVKIVKCNI